MGCAPNSIRAATPWVQCRGKDLGEISDETRQASLANLENISCQSSGSDCGRRFFHDPNDQFPAGDHSVRSGSMSTTFQALAMKFAAGAYDAGFVPGFHLNLWGVLGLSKVSSRLLRIPCAISCSSG